MWSGCSEDPANTFFDDTGLDAGALDAPSLDGAVMDGTADGRLSDVGSPRDAAFDAASGDSAPSDAASSDAPASDASPSDAAPIDATVDPTDAGPDAPMDAGDRCAHIPVDERCTDAAPFCDGDMRVRCVVEGGCGRWVQESCGDARCVMAEGTALCESPVCPMTPCTAEGTVCDGDTLLHCTRGADTCFEATETNCAATGDRCGERDGAATCYEPDPCEGLVQCDAEGTTCDGNTVVICVADAMGCLVETRHSCSEGREVGVCEEIAGSAVCADACEGLPDRCEVPSRTCDGDTLRRCAPDENGCLVESEVLCDAAGAYCDGAASGGDRCAESSCPAASVGGVTLGCGSTVTIDTAGTRRHSYYDCGRATGDYKEGEHAFTFAWPDLAYVEVEVERLEGAAEMDLFVLDGSDGSVCSRRSPCLASDTADGAESHVRFDHVPGRSTYVFYDSHSSGSADLGRHQLHVRCTFPACGDGIIQDGEECDDHGTAPGDGCSPLCQVEPGYVCDEDSSCALSCGDNVVNGDDECDDGNHEAGDGCAADCTIEVEPRICEVGAEHCPLFCGDGWVDASEACDDGDLDNGDGCNDVCQVEEGYFCTSLPSQCGVAEEIFEGTLEAADSTWTRPTASCSAGDVTAHFDTWTYTNSTGAAQTLDVMATFEDFDGYLFVYDGPPAAGSPTDGCILGSDDHGSERYAFVPDRHVEPGASLTVVVSSYAAGATGSYAVGVTR